MADTPVPPEAVPPERLPQAHWPEEARIAGIAALDYRARRGAIDVAAHVAWLLVTDILDAAAPLIVADERDRIRKAAQAAKVTFYRPGNGPAQGQVSVLVPLDALLEAIGGTGARPARTR